MLGDEFGTASNIKSRVNRQSVLGAITSAQQRLKLYNKVGQAVCSLDMPPCIAQMLCQSAQRLCPSHPVCQAVKVVALHTKNQLRL